MTKAKDLQPGDRFRSEDKPDFLTCQENRGLHLFYGQLINTEERGTLSMPADLELVIDERSG